MEAYIKRFSSMQKLQAKTECEKCISYLYSRLRDGNGCAARTKERLRKQRTGKNYSPRDIETANRLSNESAT